MNTTYSVSAASNTVVPTAHIATHKNRQKQYNPNSNEPIYYLNNNDEFQLELYNPTQYVVRCDIWLNGSIIPGGGLVLRPAERIFLDRYLNSPKKFAFETYKVGSTDSDKQAIANNGSVQVKFYKETISRNLYTTITAYAPYTYNTTVTPYYGNTFTVTATGSASTVSANFIDTTSIGGIDSIVTSNKSCGLLTDSPDPIEKAILKRITANKVETGRVGKGSESNQKFTNSHYEFDYLPFHTVQYKILPYSQKPQTTNTLNKVRYCTKCGSKLKPRFKFCANCGAKL